MGSSYEKQAVGCWFTGDGDGVTIVLAETVVDVPELPESLDDTKRQPEVKIMTSATARTVNPHLILSHRAGIFVVDII